jgi:hypothetical protein
MIASSLVDWQLLGRAIVYSVVFGLGVLIVAGLAVAASLRAQDARSDGDGAAFVGSAPSPRSASSASSPRSQAGSG